MGRVDTDLRALINQAWRQHHRDPVQLLPLGQQIVQAAGADLEAAGWGWLHQAWGQRFRSDTAAAQLALDKAQALFTETASAAGLSSCRDLQAMVLGLLRRWEEALDLLAQNDAVAAQRTAFERCQTHLRRGWACDALGRRDDALRERYALLATARETDDDAATAQALGLLGGLHADLYNLEEAEALCAQAALLAERSGAFQAWAIATLNRMNTLLGLGRGVETLPLAQALMTQESRLNQRAREQRCIVYADAHTACAQHGAAQALLDESRALRHQGSESLLSWTTAQVVAWVAQGQAAQARELAQSWLDQPAHGTDPGSVPSEQLRLLQALSAACEALGDTAAALRWARQAFAVHETLVGRSQRARRLALEIEHRLAFERWQRQQAEQEHTRLEGLNQALAAASHDLRQPVQALALNMAALEQSDVTPVQAQLVQRMGRSLQALSQMFDVLLDISRLDAGIVTVAAQPLDLRPLLLRLHDEVSATAAARGLQLRLRLPKHALAAGVPLLTHTDPVLLERCLRNLLDNAIKYTVHGQVLLALRPGGLDADGGPAWRLQVWDTGIGMSPEVQARVFEEFFQADNPERDRARGLGLGLAIVQRLASLLGHGLGLRSLLGHGTLLQLSVPRLAAPEVSSAPKLAVPAAGGHATLCVAVMDDDADVREGLVSVLERWGHTVLAGPDHMAVLQRWHASGRPPVQAIVSDLRLRGSLTGVQAVAVLRLAWSASSSTTQQTQIQAQPATVPALVITGDVSPERLQLLRDSGLPWLPKPVMPMRLRSWLTASQPGGAAKPLG